MANIMNARTRDPNYTPKTRAECFAMRDRAMDNARWYRDNSQLPADSVARVVRTAWRWHYIAMRKRDHE